MWILGCGQRCWRWWSRISASRPSRLAGGDLAACKSTAAERGAWICFADESGQSLRSPKGRTWASIGQTPIARVTGKGSGRVSVAGLVCIKPGQRSDRCVLSLILRNLNDKLSACSISPDHGGV